MYSVKRENEKQQEKTENQNKKKNKTECLLDKTMLKDR